MPKYNEREVQKFEKELPLEGRRERLDLYFANDIETLLERRAVGENLGPAGNARLKAHRDLERRYAEVEAELRSRKEEKLKADAAAARKVPTSERTDEQRAALAEYQLLHARRRAAKRNAELGVERYAVATLADRIRELQRELDAKDRTIEALTRHLAETAASAKHKGEAARRAIGRSKRLENARSKS